MYYRWRFLIIGSSLIVLSIFIVFIPFVAVKVPLLAKQNVSIYLSDLAFLQLSYHSGNKQLYTSDMQIYELYVEDVKIEAVTAIRGKRTYHVYFLQQYLIDGKKLFIKSKQYEGPLLLATITRIPDAPVYFLDRDDYFIRADLTYICNATLLQQKKGQCHPESYYIEFSDLL